MIKEMIRTFAKAPEMLREIRDVVVVASQFLKAPKEIHK
jgi:hypothetical protein